MTRTFLLILEISDRSNPRNVFDEEWIKESLSNIGVFNSLDMKILQIKEIIQ